MSHLAFDRKIAFAGEPIQNWPSIEDWQNSRSDGRKAGDLPIVTDLHGAIVSGAAHLNLYFNPDRDDEPFFYVNLENGSGKFHHIYQVGIPHVIGRALLALRFAEEAAGVPIPPESLRTLERFLRLSFDNADTLNSYLEFGREGRRIVEFHNFREGLYGLNVLIKKCDSAWARQTSRLMLERLQAITDENGCWSAELIERAGMQDRAEGVTFMNAGRLVDPLLENWRLTLNPVALGLARQYAQVAMDRSFTSEGLLHSPFAKCPETAHLHSVTSMLTGVAALAVLTANQSLLERCAVVFRRGLPEYFSSWGWGDEVMASHSANKVGRGEINQTGDVIRLALILGAVVDPDYFETAERFLRSMVLPNAHHREELSHYVTELENPDDNSQRDIIARCIGGQAHPLPNARMGRGEWPVTTLDITSGAVHALSEAYRQRVVFDGQECRVHLLFDYEGAEVAIQSELPFVGRLSFQVRKPLTLLMRRPPWVEPATVRVTLDGEARTPEFSGSYLRLENLAPGQTGVVVFAVPCKVERESVDGTFYTTTWIGNQIVEILPRGEVSPLPF